MRPAGILSAIVLGILATAGLDAQSLRVGIIGDQTSSPDLTASYAVLKQGVEILSRQNIAVLLHTGDIIESSRPEEQIHEDFTRAASILDSSGQPWHLTPGDHDVNAAPFQQDSADRSRETFFRDLYRQREPQLTDSLDHSFNIGSYHFVALNSQQHLHSDPRWGNVFLAKITDEQIRWLAKDLERNRRAKAIVVFLHQPLWYNWGNWTRLHELLRKYPVAAVVAGHFHYSQDEGTIDGIRYVVVGASGGITKRSNPRGPTAPQVTVLTLNGKVAVFQPYAISDGKPISLVARHVMDRLQALDLAVGQIDLSAKSFVCVQDGELFSDSSTRSPARVSMSAFGNPIDVPITIRVDVGPSTLLLKDPQFTPDACMAVENGACILRQSARVAISNNSAVEFNTRSGPLPVLWSSELIPQGAVPTSGDAMQFTIRVAFDSNAGEFYLERSAAVPVKDCTATLR